MHHFVDIPLTDNDLLIEQKAQIVHLTWKVQAYESLLGAIFILAGFGTLMFL